MANRFPLIFNSGAGQIQELAASDNLDLTSSNLVNAGILFTSSGSQTAPSISIGNGTTYPPGLYSPGTDQLAVATNGTGRVFISSAGLVSIGNSSPGSRLEIGGDASYDARVTFNRVPVQTSNDGVIGELFFQNNADSVALIAVKRQSAVDDAYIQFATQQTGGGLSEKMRLTSAGLGIGSSSPSANLEVRTTSDTGIALTNSSSVTSGNRGSIYQLNSANSTCGLFRFAAVTDNVGTEIQFYTRPAAGSLTQSMTLDSSGRLGIGNTGPSVALEIGAATGAAQVDANVLRVNRSVTGQYATFSSASGAATINGVNGSGGSIVFQGDGNPRAQIDGSGRLLVGTSDGSGGVSKLVVQGASNGSAVGVAQISYNGLSSAVLAANTDIGYLRFTDQGSNSGVFAQITASSDGTTGASDYPGRLVFSTTPSGSASPTERMRITSGGLVDIGGLYSVGANSIRFDVQGTNFSRNTTSSATHIFFVNPNGGVGSIATNGSATAYNTSSDYRLKENVVPVPDGITRLLQLKPSRFNFIVDPDQTVDGFIAHEAQAVVPECVTGEKDAIDDDGNHVYQGIDQSKLVPLLTAALQEAIAKIETLEQRLTAAGIA